MKKIQEETLYKGEWLAIKKSTFQNTDGRHYSWEHLERTGSGHAVVILATLRPSGRIILVREFRPGSADYVLALPAGMVESENAGENALRELHEETGYTGTVTRIDPIAFSFPALSGATMQLVHLDVDETLSVNQNPNQHLEPGEFIETLLVPRAGMRAWLETQSQAGHKIAAGLWYLFALAD